MDPAGNERRIGVETSISIDIAGIEHFLKRNNSGDDVKEALRWRTMIHWMRPEMDRLSGRMLPVYKELIGHLEWPFSILDAGCMCGWLKHFIERHNNGHFNYVGMDIWKEALEVAVEFDPYIRVEQGSILTDKPPLPLGEGFSDKYSYTWCSNIQFGKDAPKVIENMMAVTEKFAFFGR